MVFNENTNYDFILFSKQGRTQLIYSTELTTEHVFENFGVMPGCYPLIAVSTSKTCQHHLQTRAAKVWDLVQSDQWNLATQTGQLSRDLYVDTATGSSLELEHHAGFAKLTRWIMKTIHSKYSFALSIHSDVRTKP